MHIRSTYFYALCVSLAFVASGCSSTKFGAASGKARKSKDPNAGSAKNHVDDEGLGGPGGKDDAGSGADAGDGSKDSGGLGNTDDAAAGDLGISECLAKKADDYNIMLIFDNSGSQLETDPSMVRRDGALSFVDRFAAYAARSKTARVNMAVLSFNTASIRSAQGWIRLSATTAADVKAEITTATANPDGMTAYSPVLNDAATFFSQLQNIGKQDRIKNYVVFLTDGLPNAADPLIKQIPSLASVLVESMADIPVAVDRLVNSYNVAMISIAAGPQIPLEGESITQSLAKPAVGLKDKDHVGIYRRAKTPEDLKSVWESLFAEIGACN